jgi:hypothetical protein
LLFHCSTWDVVGPGAHRCVDGNEENRPYLRLFFEMHGLALQYPGRYASYLQGSAGRWIVLLTSALAPELGRARGVTMATLIVGVIDGFWLRRACFSTR